MSGCPAYLGVVINNRLELDELFRYDLLILCPAEFNLTFKVGLHFTTLLAPLGIEHVIGTKLDKK